MSILLDVILPVFLLIGAGYLVARARYFDENAVDGLMRFGQSVGLPVLLFRSIARLDLGTAFHWGLMVSFYIGAFAGFTLGFLGARWLFRRSFAESVAVGFTAFFSNTLLLGLPITERAYGPGALAGNYAIISIHAPMLYTFGIILMEWARSRHHQGLSRLALARQVLKGVFTQPLVIGIGAGFAVNLSGLPLPGAVSAAVEMLAGAALPVALFGLGGVLWRYRPEGDKGLIVLACLASLVLHPLVTWGLGRFAFGLDVTALRSATITAAMAPGVNAYMFAHMYGVGRRAAASSVLMATALSLFTTWGWLQILP